LVDVIIPASHNFPHTAKVLTLSFILFAGWFDGSPVPISDYPFLFVSGIAATFGSVNIAVPFLLDLMQLPHDLFQLFVATSVLNARFGTLLQAMHMLALTLLGTCALTGRLHFSLRKIVVYAAVSIALVVVGIGGARALFSVIVDTSFTKGQVLYSMQPILPTAEAVVHSSPPAPAALDPARSRLEQIQTRGSLRVCFRNSDSVPFSYFASNGDLVGLDVEMAHSLARGLSVSLEFVPVQIGYRIGALGEPLSSGYCDIMMDRTVVTMDAIGQVLYSQPYLELTIGILALDHRRREFSNLEEVVKREDLRLAVPDSRYFQQRFQRYLPNTELITVQNMREFLEDRGERFDAMIYAVEIGSAWSLLYPEYGVVVPKPSRGRVPMAFGLPRDEYEWKSAVDAWIDLKRADRTIDRLYDHWILGRETEEVQPRWSVIRDVLGWID
jgi:ABC-type amino acid transport substrate-binding protein